MRTKLAAVYALALSSVIALTACSADKTVLTAREDALSIDGSISRDFHASLYYPKGLGLHYPGYLIGVQKAYQDKVRGPSATGKKPSFLNLEPEYFKAEPADSWGLGSINRLKQITDDWKALFVAHVTKYDWAQNIRPDGADTPSSDDYPVLDSCLIYNAMSSPVLAHLSSDWQDLEGALFWKHCLGAPTWPKPSSTACAAELCGRAFYENGVPALRALQASVTKDLDRGTFTHVLVIVMGWNTNQNEAIRNFNDITGNMIEAARECGLTSNAHCQQQTARVPAFRPLVIGISWPSIWSYGWMNPLSYANKAGDADELGLSWLNLLTNRILPDAIKASKEPVPLILIGHSFGARAALRATAAEPALAERAFPAIDPPHPGPQLVVGLQGAVSINRFDVSAGDEGAPLRDFQTFKNTQIVLTASQHDDAAGNDLIVWHDAAGSGSVYDLACSRPGGWYAKVFRCLRAQDKSGREKPLPPGRPSAGFSICEPKTVGPCRKFGEPLALESNKRVLYIDASDGITEFNTLGTGGNAHSDIYRLPMGRLLWMLVSSFAPDVTG
jgi:hypothetical protein